MLGKELYKIEADFELSSERLKSLVFFYEPLIGKDALVIYETLVAKGNNSAFEQINGLLEFLNISIDELEKACDTLNEYKLLKTLQNEDKYILVFVAPLTIRQFIKDDILVRAFILKTSGKHYQSLIADLYRADNHNEFKDISKTMELKLNEWTKEDESYLNINKDDETYTFDTFFNINVFLKDISTNLLPLRFRTKDNLYKLATLADLYNISYDTMRSFLPRVFNTETNEFDANLLEYLCRKAKTDYEKVPNDKYDVPCKLYLMSLQDGKDVTEYDMKIIYKLSNDYHLSPSVINVVLEHGLRNCDNRLIEKYLYGIASDLHRNNITTAKAALQRLDKYNGRTIETDSISKYDASKNNNLSEVELNDILSQRGKHD